MSWISDMCNQYGDVIRKQKMSRRQVAATLGCTEWQARKVISALEQGVQVLTPVNPVSKEQVEKSTRVNYGHKYVYIQEDDQYITFITRSKEPLVVSGENHRAMKRAYSNWDGSPASINHICQKFSIPRAWFIEYKQIHGWTHDSDPFSAEEILTRPEQDLVEDALQQRRRAITTKFEQQRWEQVQRDAQKWLRFETEVLSRLEQTMEGAHLVQAPKLALRPTKNKFCVVTSATDFHWGMYSWGKETGETYNRQVALQRLQSTTEDLINSLPGQPEEIVLAVGSDWFHVDGDVSMTTKGTPQDIEGSPAEIMVTGCEVARDHILMLKQVAPVRVVQMAGNHDRVNSLALLLYLSAWFKDDPDVTVVQNFQPRVYHTYGNTLIGFHHGDQTPLERLGPCMATEAREAWGQTRHHVFFSGHLHHDRVREVNGIKHFQMPSLAGTDRWHARKGYVDTIPALAAYVVDHQKGVTCTITCPADE